MHHVLDRYSLLPRLAALAGVWVGDVYAPHGGLLGRAEVTGQWNPATATLLLTSCVATLGGRVWRIERGHIAYDPQTDAATAIFTGPDGVTELAHAYANQQGEVILVSDCQLYMRRVTWPPIHVGALPGSELRVSCVALAEDDRLHTINWTSLRRVGLPPYQLAAE